MNPNVRGGEHPHDHPQAEASGRPGGPDRQGRLNHHRARAGLAASRPPRPGLQLKHGLEIFEAPDGHIYLLGGLEGDVVIEGPSPQERDLFARLRAGTDPELALRDCNQPHEVGEALLEAGVLMVRDGGPTDSQLSSEERQRFDRQLAYFADMRPGLEDALQARLCRASVVILGVGGLGSWTAAALACTGVGRLVLIDDDRVELSNLNRQLLFRRDQVGTAKVDAAAEALAAFNPELEIVRVPERITGPGQLDAFLEGSQFLVETADWPIHAINSWVNQACHQMRMPHAGAGQFPPLVRIGPMVVPGETGCIACQEQATRSNFPHYDALVAFRQANPLVSATLGPASGVIGSLLAMDICHYLTGIAEPATLGASVTLDLRTWQMDRQPVVRDPDCSVCAESRPLPTAV
jgi:bacteriocin biosynthesis cyclodehydratase domain-containing protein